MRRHYFLAYWLLFFAVLTNIDLGISLAGMPLNFQRAVFAAVIAFLLVDIGTNPGRRLLLPNYVLVLLFGYYLLFLLELYHSIRLHSFGAMGLQFCLTLCLIVVLSFLKSGSTNMAPNMTWLTMIFAVSIVVTIMQSADLATLSQSIVLDGNFYNSMRLRSSDSRNIVNVWAAGVVIAFIFLSDLCWQHVGNRRRRLVLLSLATIAGLVTLLSASRAALGLFILALMLVSVREIRSGGRVGALGVVVFWVAGAFVAVHFLQDSALLLRVEAVVAGQDISIAKRLLAFGAVSDRIDTALLIGHGKSLHLTANVATENTLLGVAHRFGILGLLIFIGMWSVILVRAFRGGSRGFRNSIAITFLSLLTNDLLFFPVALFVTIEALHLDSQHNIHRIGVDHRNGGAQPA